MSGLFGVVATEDCVHDLFYGTDYHSHMGTERAGLAVLGEKFQRGIHDISQGQFKSKFFDILHQMQGNFGIGVISDREPQPLVVGSKFGTFAITTVGQFQNIKDTADRIFSEGHTLVEMSNGSINSTEMVAKLISRGNNLVDGIRNAQKQVEGSFSLLILNQEGIYAARDLLGRTPLIVGQKEGATAIASESCAFQNLGYQIKTFLAPGEIVLLTPAEIKQMLEPQADKKICAFLWIYTGFPASAYEGIGVESVREKCGRLLAKRDTVKADFVTGVPDSGIGHAIGYAMESGLPYRRPLVKYSPGYGRSYTPPSQEIRDLVATMKLVAIQDIIVGNRLIVCEDSIVRGTQLKNFTIRKLWDAGAREIHIRPACPPLMFRCKYLRATRSLEELAVRRAIHALEGKHTENITPYLDENSSEYKKMVDYIAHDLEITSLQYQRLEDMISAIGLPQNQLCTYCWTGQ